MLRLFYGVALTLAAAAAVNAAPMSGYAGEQHRPLKALSEQQVADLKAGRGAGQAKTAELNGYPGPMHVVAHADDLALSDDQLRQSQEIFAAMRARAVELGEQLIEAESALEAMFRSRTASRDALAAALARIGTLQSQLRGVHLQAHVDQVALLDATQLERYAVLRGYAPEGHPGPEQTSHH